MTERERKGYKHSISVGGLASFEGKLILVKDNDGKFGLPAGHAEFGENPVDAFARELAQETGLNPDLVSSGGLEISIYWIAGEKKTKIGVVLSNIEYKGQIDQSEWAVKDEEGDINLVRLFTPREVLNLIQNPEKIRKPTYNTGQLIKWLLGEFNRMNDSLLPHSRFPKPDEEGLKLLEDIRIWILQNYKIDQFLRIKDPLNYSYLVYRPPYAIADKGIMVYEDLESLEETNEQRA